MFTLRGENTVVNATEVQRDFSRVMAQVWKQNIIIIRNNEPIAAIVSLDKLKKIRREEEGKKKPLSVQCFIHQIEKSSKEFKKNIECITLFGSYARGEQTKNSDIDLLVLVKKKSKKWADLLLEISEEAMAKSNYEDLLATLIMTETHWKKLEKAKALLVEEIKGDGILLWKNS